MTRPLGVTAPSPFLPDVEADAGWRPLAGLFVVVGGTFLASIPLALAIRGLHGLAARHPFPAPLPATIDMGLILGSVALVLPMLALALRWLHGVRLADLLAPGLARPCWRLSRRSALLWGGLLLLETAAETLIDHARGDTLPPIDLERLPHLALYAITTLPLLALQVTGEEALFRGYLTRALSRWRLPGLATALVVAVAFAGVHTQSWGTAVWDQRLLYVCLSLLLSWISKRTGGLEAAIGIHFAQNVAALYLDGAMGDDYPSLLGLGAPKEQAASLADVGQVAITIALMAGLYAWVAIRTRWLERP